MSSMDPSTQDRDALLIAEAAHAAVQQNAARGRQIAERALRLARAQRRPEAQVAALHALGFAQYELGDPRAIATLRAAVLIAERHGLQRRAALARRPLSMYLAYRGSITAARRELEAAREVLDEHELARTEVFSIALSNITGRRLGSLEHSERALALLRRRGDRIWEARLRRNRGMLLADRGDPAAAEADLRRARDLYAALGATDAAAGAELQLARVTLTRGDLPGCLAQLDAIASDAVSPRDHAELELLRARALAGARLVDEAVRAIAVTSQILESAGSDDYELQLELPRLMLLAGEPVKARDLAGETQRSFAAQGRRAYAARAAELGLAASIAARELSPAMLRRGRRAAATLAAAGWEAEARRARLAVARAAVELGSVGTARRELTACDLVLRRGPVTDRIEAWHVEALIRLATHDPTGAQTAARRGLRVLEQHRASLGAADLRATASSIGSELAALGLRVALAGRRPGPVLEWAEALRASALRLTPVTPPANPELRSALTELRQLTAELARAEQAGRSTRSLLARRAGGDADPPVVAARPRRGAAVAGRPDPSAAGDGARAAGPVEFIELDGELTALTLVDGRLGRHELGALASVHEQLEWLASGSRGFAPALRAPQRPSLASGGDRIGGGGRAERCSRRSQATVGERELVLVPTGALHALPWAMLPSLRGRAVSLAPSAAVWWATRTRPRTRADASSRSPDHASATPAPRSMSHRPHPNARTLTGHDATVAAPSARSTAPPSPTSPATATSAPTARCSPHSNSPTATSTPTNSGASDTHPS